MSNVLRWKVVIYIWVSTICLSNLSAQTENVVLTYRDYISEILSGHPIAKKADLQLRLADAESLGARGFLDPAIRADWNQKNFDDKLYYRKYQAEVIVPTVLGVEIVGGYENAEGVFLNPENSINDYGLWHLGVEVNILQGLWVNERKTALEQAEIFQELVKNEQQIILNDLVYQASIAYLLWQKEFYAREVLLENTTLALSYYENTRTSYFNGEKTGLDTLEAFILYQDALTFLQNNNLQLIKAKQNLENYLWRDNQPVILRQSAQPENYRTSLFSLPQDPANINVANHPILQSSINNLNYTELEQKLKKEKLKPKLALKYHPLLATSENSISPNFSTNDYKWGFDFSMPLLWRKERADIQKGRIKIEEIKLDILDKQNELTNKIEGSYLQLSLLDEQLNLLIQNVDNYQRLLSGENELFRLGESSVFLLNKRQEKYISAQLKLIETHIKRKLEILNFLYYSNLLIDF